MKKDNESQSKSKKRYIALTGDGSEFSQITLATTSFIPALAEFDSASGPILWELDIDAMRTFQLIRRLTKTFDDVALLDGEQMQREPAMKTIQTDFDIIEPDALENIIQDMRATEATAANQSDVLLRRSMEKFSRSDFADPVDAVPDGAPDETK